MINSSPNRKWNYQCVQIWPKNPVSWSFPKRRSCNSLLLNYSDYFHYFDFFDYFDYFNFAKLSQTKAPALLVGWDSLIITIGTNRTNPTGAGIVQICNERLIFKTFKGPYTYYVKVSEAGNIVLELNQLTLIIFEVVLIFRSPSFLRSPLFLRSSTFLR